MTGTVSLEAEKKGINMSRIMRSFYAHAGTAFSLGVIEAALDDYKRDLESFDARIALRFSYPMEVSSLRSGLLGWQYYDIALETRGDGRSAQAHPASRLRLFLDLPLFAGTLRTCAVDPRPARDAPFPAIGGADFGGDHRRRRGALDRGPRGGPRAGAVATETQVMVKREDEQAFAEV